MSKHHKLCKWKNYTAVEVLPCPFCRIEELTEREADLIMKCNDLTRKEYTAQNQIAKLDQDIRLLAGSVIRHHSEYQYIGEKCDCEFCETSRKYLEI